MPECSAVLRAVGKRLGEIQYGFSIYNLSRTGSAGLSKVRVLWNFILPIDRKGFSFSEHVFYIPIIVHMHYRVFV